MATDKVVAPLYYGAVHSCFFRDDETSPIQFLEECDNIQNALDKLTTQKEHVQGKIKNFTDSQSKQLVDGCLDVVNVKDRYNHVRERLRAHRENLLNSKIIMATLPRNVRTLQFEKEIKI